MSRRPENRVLAGPLDGNLSHKDVQDLFSLYGKVLYAGWYHHTSDPPETYCFVEFATEVEAKQIIRYLREGSLSAHGKSLRMVNIEAVGSLPGRMEEWHAWLRIGWTDERKLADADGKGKGKAKESSRVVESADVDTKSPMYKADADADDDKTKGKHPQGQGKVDDHAAVPPGATSKKGVT